jgi:hypothetical protein
MPRRALLHEGYPAEKDDDEIAARCREWRAYQQLSNGAEVPAANQCPCGESGLSKVQVRLRVQNLDVGLFYSFLFRVGVVIRVRRARRQTETPLLFKRERKSAFLS